ncbi:hypothetical protein PR048_011691, partial [Dryococelus australis]
MAGEVWDYFQINCMGENFAVCNICCKKISRGGKSHITSNLRKHLKSQHSVYLMKKRKLVKPTELGPSTSELSSLHVNLILLLLFCSLKRTHHFEIKLFDRATFAVSSSNVCISEVIPIINSILQQLQVPPPAGFGLQGMVNDLLASLKMRCGQVEEIWLYTAATLLDPCFKGKVFSDRIYLDTAKISLQQEAEKIVFHSNCAEDEKLSVETMEKAVGSRTQSMWNLYSVIMKNNSSQAVCASAVDEVETYLQEPLAPADTDVLTYWKNKQNLSRLRSLARKHLITPAATVFSERPFSTAGLIVGKKGNRLDIDRVKMLVFLQKNLSMKVDLS